MVIDKFGKFPYVLVKLSDRMAGNKLIVRGKNGRSEPQLVSAVSKEVSHWLQSLQASSGARVKQVWILVHGEHWARIQNRKCCMVMWAPAMADRRLLLATHA